MSNCVLYSYKLHSSSRTLLQDDDFFFAKKSVVGKTLFPNFTSILSCSIIFAWAKFTIGFTTHSVVAAPKTLCSVVVILRSSVPSQLVIPSEKKFARFRTLVDTTNNNILEDDVSRYARPQRQQPLLSSADFAACSRLWRPHFWWPRKKATYP